MTTGIDSSEWTKWWAWYGRTWGQLTVSGFAFVAALASATAAWLNVRVARQNVGFQKDAEKRKRDADLFDHRFAVYRDFRKFIGDVRTHAPQSDWSFLFELGEIRERAYFLFPLHVEAPFQDLRRDVEKLDHLLIAHNHTTQWTPEMIDVHRQIVEYHNKTIQNAMKAYLLIGAHSASSMPAQAP